LPKIRWAQERVSNKDGENYTVWNFVILSIKYFDARVKEDEMSWTCSTDGDIINACKIFAGKYEGKRPHTRR
jgi:hypothetical protein